MMGVGRRKGRGAKIAQRPESEGRGIWQEPEPKYYAVTHSLAPAQGHILPPPLRGCPVLGLPYRTRPTAHSSPDHRGAHLVVIIHPCIQNIQPATHSPPLRACTAMISSFGRGPRATQHPQPHISRAAATTNPSFFFSSCTRISASAMAVQDSAAHLFGYGIPLEYRSEPALGAYGDPARRHSQPQISVSHNHSLMVLTAQVPARMTSGVAPQR